MNVLVAISFTFQLFLSFGISYGCCIVRIYFLYTLFYLFKQKLTLPFFFSFSKLFKFNNQNTRII